MQLSEKIVLLRKRRGLSQEQLANELDVSRQAIYKWETGQTTPEIEKVKRLSDIFNVSLSDLLNDNVDIAEVPIVITNNEEDEPQEFVDKEAWDESLNDAKAPNKEEKGKKKNVFLICLLLSVSLIAIALGIALALALNRDEPSTPPTSSSKTSHICVFGAYEVEIEPSYNKAGLERRYCEKCDATESRAIPTVPHSEVIINGYESTCSKGGLTDGIKCSNCNTILKEQMPISINKDNHTEQIINGYASSCTKTGLTNGVICSDCKKALTPQAVIDVDPEAHTRVAIEGKAATCVEKGQTDGVKCSECNKILQGQVEIDFIEHTVEIIEGYDATCLRDGLTEGKRCSYCKIILLKQQIIESNGQHIKETIKGYASTCTTAGKSDGVRCTECNEILTEQKDLALAPHTESITPGYDSTCTKTGLGDKIVCSACSYVISPGELIKVKDHSYVDKKCTVCQNYEANLNDFTFNLNEDNSSYSVVYYGGGKSDTELIIPSTYNGLPVTHIERVDEANSVTNVIIPNTITHIDESAFLFESSIKHINIPNSVVSIGSSAFCGCSSLVYLYIPNSVLYMGSSIAGTERYSGNSMEKLIIYCQNGVDTTNWSSNWNTYEHVDSTSENPVYLKHTLVYVNSENDITGKNSYEEDGTFKFVLNDDEASYSVTASSNFKNTTRLEIPSEYKGLPVTIILPYAFYENTVIEEVFIPGTIKKIDTSAFDGCTSLKRVEIDTGVEIIMTRAFANTSIQSIFIPSTVATMGAAVFDGCNSLNNIFCQLSSQPPMDNVALTGWHMAWTANGNDHHYCINWGYKSTGYTDDGFLWVQSPKDEFCIAGYYGDVAEVTVPSSVNDIEITQILPYAFYENTILEKVIIPSTVIKIGEYAFDKCSDLKSVVIGSGAEYIGNEAFSETAIESIYIPSAVAAMGAAVFDGCDNLKNIYCQVEGQPSEWSFLWLVNGITNHSCVSWGILENPIE